MLYVTVISITSFIFAYVGPGPGISALGALWAVILAILMTVFGLLAWPIRSLLRQRKKKREQAQKSDQ